MAASAGAAFQLELREMRAGDLKANPANWRTHPPQQLAAIKAVLGDDQVGWAGAILVNRRTDRVVDGHGRLETLEPDAVVPVLVGDWDEAGERKILASLDPIASMASRPMGMTGKPTRWRRCSGAWASWSRWPHHQR